MKYSITGKITAIMLSLVAGTVLLCWFINTTLLETYYVEHKQQKLLETYEMVNKASSSGEAWTEEFAIRLEKVCANSNITRMIIGSDNIILDSNVGDDETLLLQFLELIFRKNKNVEILESTDRYVVEKMSDKRLKTDYLVLCGNLSDGNSLLMRTALESIKESVDIANRFLAYVGIVAVVLCAVIIYAVTRKITNPILQLADISNRMTNLDFDAKFPSKGKNEIDMHLCICPLFNHLISFILPEYTGNIPDTPIKLFFNTFAVFLRRKIQNCSCIPGNLPVDLLSPVLIEVSFSGEFQPGLHLQAVRNHTVKRMYYTIQARQDTHMLLHIFPLQILKHRRRHILILQTFICKKRRRKPRRKLDISQPAVIKPGNFVIALPQCLQFFIT